MINLKLNDAKLSIDESYLLKNKLFENISESSNGSSPFELTLDLSFHDFLIILNYLSENKKPERGNVNDFDRFFNVCQYLGEIELPLLVTKDSNMIQRFALTKNDILCNECDYVMNLLYNAKDKGKDIAKVLLDYTSDPYNNKLNEKTGGALFRTIRSLKIGSYMLPLTCSLDKFATKMLNVNKSLSYDSYHTIKSSYYLDYIPIKDAIWRLQQIFFQFPWYNNDGSCSFFLAGGSVLQNLQRYTTTLTTTLSEKYNYNLFLITKDETKAKEMLKSLDTWIETRSYEISDSLDENYKYTGFRSYSKPVMITRSKNYVTFMSIHGIFKVFLRLFDSAEQVLCSFDLPPCCVGFDGYEIYTIPVGINSLLSRSFTPMAWKQCDNAAYRCMKYNPRGFDIHLVGLTNEEVHNFKKSNVKMIEMTPLQQLFLKTGYNKGDYEDNVINVSFDDVTTLDQFFSKLTWVEQNIRELLSLPGHHSIDILTKHFDYILDSTTLHDSFTQIHKEAEPIISFNGNYGVKSFHGEWFEKTKW